MRYVNKISAPISASPCSNVHKKTPVILDTDIGGDIDDTWALAMMLKSPELDVKLVVTATGDTTYRAKIVARMLEIGGRTDVPVRELSNLGEERGVGQGA